MTQIPYADSKGRLSVEVHLDYATNVYLVNSKNFQKYLAGAPFDYAGGYYDHTPVTISVKGAGRWYLIVKEGKYQYRFIN